MRTPGLNACGVERDVTWLRGVVAAAKARQQIMKQDIHPKWYPECKVIFDGKVVMTVGATVPELRVDVWSGSHPFYTGKSSFVDITGRVDKFQKRFGSGTDYFKNKKKSK